MHMVQSLMMFFKLDFSLVLLLLLLCCFLLRSLRGETLILSAATCSHKLRARNSPAFCMQTAFGGGVGGIMFATLRRSRFENVTQRSMTFINYMSFDALHSTWISVDFGKSNHTRIPRRFSEINLLTLRAIPRFKIMSSRLICDP